MLCVCHPFKQTRVVRFSVVSMNLSSRASQPIAQSKSGDPAFNYFFSPVKVISPFVSKACQMAPAIVPISSVIEIIPSFPFFEFRQLPPRSRPPEPNRLSDSCAGPWTCLAEAATA
jgi:hypothetical protein